MAREIKSIVINPDEFPRTSHRKVLMIKYLREERARLEGELATAEEILSAYESFFVWFVAAPLWRRLWVALSRRGFPTIRKES